MGPYALAAIAMALVLAGELAIARRLGLRKGQSGRLVLAAGALGLAFGLGLSAVGAVSDFAGWPTWSVAVLELLLAPLIFAGNMIASLGASPDALTPLAAVLLTVEFGFVFALILVVGSRVLGRRSGHRAS